jgi:hypothetical protein
MKSWVQSPVQQKKKFLNLKNPETSSSADLLPEWVKKRELRGPPSLFIMQTKEVGPRNETNPEPREA